MIQIVERRPEDSYLDSPYTSMFEFSEEGDTLIISPSVPLLGLTQILSMPVVQEEHDEDGSFQISLKYSLDEGLTWTEFKELSEINYLEISPLSNHISQLEFKVVKLGGGLSWFKGIDFNNSLECELPSVPSFYEEFNSHVPYYTFKSLHWTLNVLNKIYEKGILPSFVKRGNNENWEDEDFIVLWWSLLYPIALRIVLAQEFADLPWRTDLLKEYLNQRGLIVGDSTNLLELYYLMTHFYEEEMRRGSLSVFDVEREIEEGQTIRGPVARLIDCQKTSDIFYRVINSWENGWWLGRSSICEYGNTDQYLNYTQGYENEPFESLSHYSLLRGDSLSLSDGEISLHPLFPVDSVPVRIGLGNVLAPVLIPVSIERDYIVTANIEIIGNATLRGGKVYFGMYGYGQDGMLLSDWSLKGDGVSDGSFFQDDDEGLKLRNNKCTLVGILRNINYLQEDLACKALDGVSYEMKINHSSLISVMPYLHFSRETSSGSLEALTYKIKDFRICVLEKEYSYLNSNISKISKLSLKNRNFSKTNNEIEKIIKTKFLPFEEANCEIKFE